MAASQPVSARPNAFAIAEEEGASGGAGCGGYIHEGRGFGFPHAPIAGMLSKGNLIASAIVSCHRHIFQTMNPPAFVCAAITFITDASLVGVSFAQDKPAAAPPEIKRPDVSPKNQGHHYNRNAEIYMETGLRLG